ncbi:MAG: hypothetical protein ACEPOV_14805 [Hyphomicrobiales bacterium]
MKIFISLFVVYLLGMLSCKTHKVTDEYVDPISISSYKVIQENVKVNLPDSISDGRTGIAYIQGIINDSTLNVDEIKIMKLNINTSNGENIIDYYYGKELVKEEDEVLEHYLPFLQDYMMSLRIEHVKGIKNKKANIITISVKF